MTAREQERVLRRASEGGAFPHDELVERWSDSRRKQRSLHSGPSDDEVAIAREALDAAERILGEPAKDVFAAFEIAYWGKHHRSWTDGFKRALVEDLRPGASPRGGAR